jgi:glycogen synthase
MRILHVLQRYLPAIGGSERYFQEFSERFAADGHDVRVLTTDAIDLEAFWLPHKKRVSQLVEVIGGVNVERFKVWVFPQQGRLWKLLVCLPGDGTKLRYHFPSPIVPDLWKRLKALDGQFDIVHAGAIPYNSILYAAQQYAARNRVPLVFSPFMHLGESGGDDDLSRWYTRPDQIRLLRHADRLIVQTPIEMQFFLQHNFPGERMKVLGAGVNPEEMLQPPHGEKPTQVVIERLPDGPFVFQIGTQTHDKGTHFLINAMQKLWRKGKNIPLVLAGNQMSDFKTFMQQLPAHDTPRIIALGHVTEAEKIEILKRGAILTHPSRSESFGIVFLEAWMWGKPVIGARAGGVMDLIEEGVNGMLVPFGDPNQLAEKIEKLWNDSSLRQRMGSAGKQKVLARYTWDKLFEQLLPVYEQLTQEPPK